MNQREYKLMQIIEKVEAFHGLEVAEFQRLLAICKPKSYGVDEQVYSIGKPSEDMLIVLAGKLKVLSRAGEELGSVDAGSSLGEMGMFTGEPRSATVVAAEATNGMMMEKVALADVMNQDSQIRGKVLQNMVDILSERVIGANKKMEEQSRRIHQLESQLGAGASEEPEPELDLEDEVAAADDDALEGLEESLGEEDETEGEEATEEESE